MNAMPFANYEGFKELFVRNDGQRKNKVLLAYLKTGELRKYIRNHVRFSEDGKEKLLTVRDMASLFEYVDAIIRRQSERATCWSVRIMDEMYGSNDYRTDGQNGICIDGDIRQIRYVNVKQGRVYKMLIGKMYKHVILNSEFGRLLPEQVVLWMCEEMTRRWESWAKSKMPSDDLVLHVDDNFRGIYNGDSRCVGNFGSCMAGHGQWTFYRDAVKAKAAYLTNADGGIMARCVIFTEVHDAETDEVFRLAERQYASNGNELLKRVLVQKLIDGGHIDGYKCVGADCGAARSFVTNSGKSMSDRELWIECHLDYGDTLSYQDSFKSYDIDENRADNYGWGPSDLGVTDHRFESDENYDSYHGEYTDNDVVTVYVGGTEETCDEYDLDDFCYINYGSGDGEYHHVDDCTYCTDIDDYVLEDDANYSELLDEYYYDSRELKKAEDEWKEDHGWVWAECEEEYYEDEDEVTTWKWYYNSDGTWDVETIGVDTLTCKLRAGLAVEVNGEYYETRHYEKYLRMTPALYHEPVDLCAAF